MYLFAVAEDIEYSSELAKPPELLRQQDLTILLLRAMSPDLQHGCLDIDAKFLTPSLVVKADTSSNNLLLLQGNLFHKRDSKWTSPGLKNPQILQEEDYSVSGHENFFHRLNHDKHIVQIYYYLNIYPLSTDIGI